MKHVRLSYDEKDKLRMQFIACNLEVSGIPNKRLKSSEFGSSTWSQALKENAEQCLAIVLIFSEHIHNSRYMKAEIDYASRNNIPIFIMNFGNQFNAFQSFKDIDVINFTSREQHQAGIYELLSKLYPLMGMILNKKIYEILYQAVKQLPNVKWIHLISVDGLRIVGIGGLFYDADNNISSNIYFNTKEDIIAPMAVGPFSFMERVVQELSLGQAEFSIISGTTATNFVIPVGSGNEYILTMCIEGQPSLDEVMKYFADHDYFSEIEEIWD